MQSLAAHTHTHTRTHAHTLSLSHTHPHRLSHTELPLGFSLSLTHTHTPCIEFSVPRISRAGPGRGHRPVPHKSMAPARTAATVLCEGVCPYGCFNSMHSCTHSLASREGGECLSVPLQTAECSNLRRTARGSCEGGHCGATGVADRQRVWVRGGGAGAGGGGGGREGDKHWWRGGVVEER